MQKNGDKDVWLMNECGLHMKIERELMEIKSSTYRKSEWFEKKVLLN